MTRRPRRSLRTRVVDRSAKARARTATPAAATPTMESTFAPGKTPEQIRGIARALLAEPGGPLLVTRATPEVFATLRPLAPDATYSELGRTIVLRSDVAAPIGLVGVVTAGTSDLPVAEE